MPSFLFGDFDAVGGNPLYGGRTIQARGRLDAQQVEQVTEELLALAAASDDDVRVLFALHGDRLEPALALHDVVATMTPRVHLIATGRVAGAGVVVFCAVPLADRTCLPMARFHLHEARVPDAGPVGIQAMAEEAAAQAVQMRDIIAAATDMPPARVAEDLRRGMWLDAREAETYGLVGRLTMRGELEGRKP